MIKFTSIEQVRDAVRNGRVIFWKVVSYSVIEQNDGEIFTHHPNGHLGFIGDDYDPADFFELNDATH